MFPPRRTSVTQGIYIIMPLILSLYANLADFLRMNFNLYIW